MIFKCLLIGLISTQVMAQNKTQSQDRRRQREELGQSGAKTNSEAQDRTNEITYIIGKTLPSLNAHPEYAEAVSELIQEYWDLIADFSELKNEQAAELIAGVEVMINMNRQAQTAAAAASAEETSNSSLRVSESTDGGSSPRLRLSVVHQGQGSQSSHR